VEGALSLLGLGLILLGIGLFGLAIDGELSARKGRPSLAARSLAIMGLGEQNPPRTEMGRIAHRFEVIFEILTGLTALICGIALI
jgi:hypothetical protein